jgi:hypothetical protein
MTGCGVTRRFIVAERRIALRYAPDRQRTNSGNARDRANMAVKASGN